MAEQPPATPPKTPTTMAEPNSNPSESVSAPQPDPLPSSSLTPPPLANVNPSAAVTPPPQPAASLIAPPLMQPYASYRPVMQYSTLPPNPSLPPAMSYQTPVAVPPPGVMMPATTATGQLQTTPYGQPMRPIYAPMPNGGYQAMPQGSVPPPGVLRYPTPYAPMYRPYPQRPTVVMPPILRPPIVGLRPPIVPLIARPPVPKAAPEKQTTVYVGKIATSVENDFILSLLQLCGPVKSWKRPQNPTDGTYKGFGFCEFESAEGVLRALRLLSKLNLDGQELMMNVNQATRDYLEQFVEKKVESLKIAKEDGTETESVQVKTEESGDTKTEASKSTMELPKPVKEDSEKDGAETKDEENNDASTFGLVTDEERQADLEASEKLTGMIEERLRNKPLPPPPPPPALPAAEGSSYSNLEGAAPSKEGDMDVDRKEAAEDKNQNEMTPSAEQERPETTSPDRDRRHDRRGRDLDMKQREKERELERYERSRELERAKREKDREYRLRDDERRCKVREKEWESREKDKDYWRQREKEKEKERAKLRREEIISQERESEGGHSKKRKHRSSDDERRRRQREKEEDIADRLKEEEEIAEAKKRAEEEEKRKQQEEEELKALSASQPDRNVLPEENNLGSNGNADDQHTSDHDSGDVEMQLGNGEDVEMVSDSATDGRQNNSAPTKKLGFGLQGSGKRTAVPSVFKQDEEDELQKEKKMRPLVPIDYSEGQMAVHSPMSTEPASNPVAAPDFSRRGSGISSKEERVDKDKERSRRSHDRSSHRDRDRGSDEAIRTKDESRKEDREKAQESSLNKAKASDNKKLLDAKQLIDMIPRTKDELFSYTINWFTYDKNSLHERLKPWITKKITEFLGEEEPTLVDYIMSSTKEHVAASEMLERLKGILDDEAEMFVLKMWRMLIFEIKRVEAGLPMRPRA